ncbi:MAG: 5'-nucleotidase [Oscillospiraceae bacterium]|nr:5'-nucleotidase [Oscillospiraceae bacterium]
MAFDLTHPLVIGISSRALFDLEAENAVFEQQGLQAYSAYQREHECDILPQGPAFPLVKAFLNLNHLQEGQRTVEVIIMSRNSADTSLRIFHSIEHYGLDITRAALVGGADVAPYLKAFRTDLFLSAHAPDVKQAVDSGVAAGMILTGSTQSVPGREIGQIRIAFDGDAVLFSAESERIFKQHGLDAFIRNEADKADMPLSKGPFANFLMTLSNLQNLYQDGEQSPIHTALVTSRSAPAHERAIKTLRNWGVRVDEAFFLGGVPKTDILASFGAHIFFDDQQLHAAPASSVVAAAVVPYREGDDPTNAAITD